MRKVDLSFNQGETLPAVKLNALAGSTAEITEAAIHEHSPDGIHIDVRFEFAMGVLVRSGNTWTTEFSDRVEFLWELPSVGAIEIGIYVGDALPLIPSATGLIAYNEDGIEVPTSAAAFGDPGYINAVLVPPPNTDMIFVVAIGRREAPASGPSGGVASDPSGALKPIWHRLQEGGLGEVVAAEMLQGVVNAQHAAVDLLQADHAIDWRGLPIHEGLRWARAVALIEILPLDNTTPLDEVPTRVRFAQGFAEAPRVRGAARRLNPSSNRIEGWWLDWKLEEPGPQAATVGFQVRSSSVPLPVGAPRIVDLATTPGGTDVRRADNEGRGQVFLGQYGSGTDGEYTYRYITDEMRNIRSITLLVR